MQKLVFCFLLIFLLTAPLSLAGCNSHDDVTTESNNVTTEPAYSGPFGGVGNTQDRYVTNNRNVGSILSTFVPLRMLDLETGEITVLCPDPSCTHGWTSPTCAYKDLVSIKESSTGGGYTLFIATRWHGLPDVLYLFDSRANTLKMIREIASASSNGMIYGDGCFFLMEYADAKDISGNNVKKIIMLDPETEKETVIAHIPDEERIYDYTDGHVITAVGSLQGFNRILTEEPYTKTAIHTPDGKEYHTGFESTYCEGNICVKYFPPASVYLYDKAEYLKLPVDCRITTVKRTGDTVMFQTVTEDPKYILKGLDENGNEASAYLFDPVVYFVKENGDYEAFELETDYSLNITMAYGHKILAVSDTRKEGDRLISDGNELVLLFDLDTGKTFEYDFGAYDKEGKFVEIPTKEFTTKINKLH